MHGTMRKQGRENMKAKTYLLQLQTYQREIKTLAEKIEELRTQAEGVKAIRYDLDRVQTTPENRQEAIIIRMVEVISKYAAAIVRYHEEVQTRQEQINGLADPVQIEILSLRYISGWTLNKIAREKHYSYEWIRHKHGAALQAFQKKYLAR